MNTKILDKQINELSLEDLDRVSGGDYALNLAINAYEKQLAANLLNAVHPPIKQPITLDFKSLDTGLMRRYAFIAPAGYPNYPAATAAQRRYAFIGTATANLVGAPPDQGYFIWG